MDSLTIIGIPVRQLLITARLSPTFGMVTRFHVREKIKPVASGVPDKESSRFVLVHGLICYLT
jgi:hypothetical protein